MSPKMKAITAVLICSAVFFLAWKKYYAFLSRGQRPPEGAVILNEIEKNGVPEFTLNDVTGKPVSLTQFRGKIVLLNFWASWCEPCVAEFPSMQKLVALYPDDIVLLAVSGDYEQADIDTFLKAFKVSAPNIFVVWDKDQEVAKKYGTFKLPESYLIGRKGELIRKVSGVEDWATADALEYFKDLVKK